MPNPSDSLNNFFISLSPFADEAGHVYIHRPKDTDDAESSGTEVAPLESPATQAYLCSAVGPLLKQGYASDAQMRRFNQMIKGAAYTKKRRTPESAVSEWVDQKPLAQAVIKMAEQGPTRDTPQNLLGKINTLVRLHGIEINDSTWPTTPDALGRQLKDIGPVVALSGVILERHENDRPRTWSIYRKEDAPPGRHEGDGDVSAPNLEDGGGCESSDTSGPPVSPLGNRMLEYHPPVDTFGANRNGHQPLEFIIDRQGGDQ